MTTPGLTPPAEPPDAPSTHRAPPAYRPPGLIPPNGPARTWGLAVTATPLLLALTMSLLGSSSDGSASTGSAGSAGSAHSSRSSASSGFRFFGPDASGSGPRATAGRATDEASDTPPAWPYGGTGTPDAHSTPEPTATDGYGEDGDEEGGYGEGGRAGPTDTGTATATPASGAGGGPGGVVTAYFEAINARDYRTAWDLGGKNLESSYGRFVAGYADTARDTISIVSTDGPEVRLTIEALQTDGTTRSYEATYTVHDGAITAGKGIRTD